MVLLSFSFWEFYIAEDFLIHKRSGGWQPRAIYIKITTWIIMGIFYMWIIRKEKTRE